MHAQDFLTVGELAFPPKGKKCWSYEQILKRDKRAIQHLKMLKNRRLSLTEVLAWLKETQNDS